MAEIFPNTQSPIFGYILNFYEKYFYLLQKPVTLWKWNCIDCKKNYPEFVSYIWSTITRERTVCRWVRWKDIDDHKMVFVIVILIIMKSVLRVLLSAIYRKKKEAAWLVLAFILPEPAPTLAGIFDTAAGAIFLRACWELLTWLHTLLQLAAFLWDEETFIRKYFARRERHFSIRWLAFVAL